MAVAGLEAGPAGIRERSLTRPPARPPDYGHFEGEEGVGMQGGAGGGGGSARATLPRLGTGSRDYPPLIKAGG